MEIVLNELSLDGQFDSIPLFVDSMLPMVKIQKIIEYSNVTLLRHHELYNRPVTVQHKLHHILTDNSMKTFHEIRVFKILLKKLMNDQPFWTDSPIHSSNDCYTCEFSAVTHGHALAEACERERVILSFEHKDFLTDSVEIGKNGVPIVLINITNDVTLVKLLWENELIIDPTAYCNFRFAETKLSFRLLDEAYGFNGLEREEVKAFLSSFELFSKLEWDDIYKSDGLQFKPYSPSSKQQDWFRNSPYRGKSIQKFRTSQKYRCFGYREKDMFHVIRFESDHEQSDHG